MNHIPGVSVPAEFMEKLRKETKSQTNRREKNDEAN